LAIHFQEVAKSPKVENKLATLAAAPAVLGEKAVDFLIKMTDDNLPEVQLHAIQVLATLEGGRISEFFRGLLEPRSSQLAMREPDVVVLVIAADYLIEHGDPTVAPLLYQRLRAYVEDPLYPTRWKRVNTVDPDNQMTHNNPTPIRLYDPSETAVDIIMGVRSTRPKLALAHSPDDSLREQLIERSQMEIPIILEGEPGKEGPPLTLKKLALFAIHQFGTPPEAAPLLRQLLYLEEDQEDMLLAAQALRKLEGPYSLPAILRRVERKESHAPDELFLFAIETYDVASRKLKAGEIPPEHLERIHRILEGTASYIFGFLLHKNPKVRQEALKTLRAANEEGALSALTGNTKNTDESIRRAVAESLGQFNDPRAVRLLIKMLLEDASELVRDRAKESLLGFTDQPAKGIVNQEARRNPALMRMLTGQAPSS
jgi:HEAT repeat protein